VKRFINNLLAAISSAGAPPVEAEQAPQPALWLRSDAAPVLDELTARQLRGRAKAMVISASTLAARSHLSRERLRDVLLERTPPAEGELRWIKRALDGIQADRDQLFALAEQNQLQIGLIF